MSGVRPEAAISIDPAIAAAAYLDRIPAAVRAAAAAGTNADHWRLVVDWGATGLILAAVLKSRVMVRLQQRMSGGRAAAVLGAIVFVLMIELARIPVALFVERLWPGDGGPETAASLLAGVVIALLGGVPLLLLVQAVARRRPRWGWAGLGLAAAAIVFCALLLPPVTMSPGARGDRPASGPEAARILAFVRQGGLEASRLDVFDGRDPLSVDMEGLGANRHAAVSRAALAAPQPETFAAIGHLLGHYLHHDLWSLALLWSGLIAALLFGLFRLHGPIARRLCGVPVPALFDPAALPVIGLMVWVFLLVATPVFNVFDQAINYRADDYAMGLTRDPDALCRWLIATEQTSKADPSAVEALLFYDHPPLAARLRNAQRWKVSHGL